MDSGKARPDAHGLDPDAVDRPLFTTTIRPHQSLGLAGFRVLMILFGGISWSA